MEPTKLLSIFGCLARITKIDLVQSRVITILHDVQDRTGDTPLSSMLINLVWLVAFSTREAKNRIFSNASSH